MSELSKEYFSSYSNFKTSMNAIEKRVNITVSLRDLQTLKNGNYKLCFAKKVGSSYTVVWQSYNDYLYNNEFSWTPIYQLFGTNTFREGMQVRLSTNKINIGLGEIATLDENGWLNNAVTGGTSKTAINLVNNYPITIHPGIEQVSTGINGELVSTPIYVAEKAIVRGNIELTPKEEVMVWFEQDIETSTMISNARSLSKEINLTNVNEASITYKDGVWLTS